MLIHPTQPRARLATIADLIEDDRMEIIHGVITERGAQSGEHGATRARFSGALDRRFQRQPTNRWPGGWWFASDFELEYETHEVYLHDVAGWRRERVPTRPGGRPVRIRPDWACEILSPSNSKRDLVDKFSVLQRNMVPHYWIVDPLEHALIVHRWTSDGYLVTFVAGVDDVVRAEPFETVELRMSVMFGLEDDEE